MNCKQSKNVQVYKYLLIVIFVQFSIIANSQNDQLTGLILALNSTELEIGLEMINALTLKKEFKNEHYKKINRKFKRGYKVGSIRWNKHIPHEDNNGNHYECVSLILTNFGNSWRAKEKVKGRINHDFLQLKNGLEKQLKLNRDDIMSREEGESPEREHYQVFSEQNPNKICLELIKIRGGCLGRAEIYLHVLKELE